MPKLALFADIHSNLEAITACMEHAQALQADRYVFLGDMVGYGADPVAVLDLVEHHAANGAVVVLGNHDAAAVGRLSGRMNANAEAAIIWTRDQLGERQLAFLRTVPLTVEQYDMLFVHASAAAPERWIYVSDPAAAHSSIGAGNARYVFCGHVHEQGLYFMRAGGQAEHVVPVPGIPVAMGRQRRWLAVVGSVGQPRDGNNAACYALFDTELEELTHFRVPYAHGIAANKIRAAGLPPRLALRLEHGT